MRLRRVNHGHVGEDVVVPFKIKNFARSKISPRKSQSLIQSHSSQFKHFQHTFRPIQAHSDPFSRVSFDSGTKVEIRYGARENIEKSEENTKNPKGKEARVGSPTRLKALSKGSEHTTARPAHKYKSGTLFRGLATLAFSFSRYRTQIIVTDIATAAAVWCLNVARC